MATSLSLPKSSAIRLSAFTWIVVLLVSNLPDAIWQALIGEPPAWLFWAKIGLLLALVLAGLISQPLRPVRTYFSLLLVLMLALWLVNWLRATPGYVHWENSVSWVAGMAGFQGLKLGAAAILVIVLVLFGKRRADFFLTWGQLKSPIRGGNSVVKPGGPYLSWGGLGLILGLCIAPLTLLFFGIGNLPSTNLLAKALPFFPVAFLFAATNAFSEELQFRASLLGELQKALGPDQALWLTAAFFGLAHYFSGPPSGVLGVFITGLLGALFAKCMLGSRGLVVPWFIHFCQNAVIYAFMAIGSVA